MVSMPFFACEEHASKFAKKYFCLFEIKTLNYYVVIITQDA